MRWLKFFKSLTILSVAFSLKLATLPSLVNIAQAQPDSESSEYTSLNHFAIDFQPSVGNLKPEEGNGSPGQSVAGGSRGGCTLHNSNSDNQERAAIEISPITVLMPVCPPGLTFAAHPTFFLYFVQSPAQEVFVTLEDEDNNVYYEGTLPISTDSSGISRITLPESAPNLEIGKTYEWSFVMLYRGNSFLLNGEVKRVKSSLITGTSPSLELAAQYASQGIWFDLIQILADLRNQEPDNIEVRQAWDDILKDEDVALEALANQLLQ